MPLYEYVCTDCESKFELLRPFSRADEVAECPHCHQRVVRQPHSGDLVHECNSGQDVFDQEDVLVTGDWEDFSGSANNAASVTQCLGLANSSWGTEAGLEGASVKERTVRGKVKSTHRQRQHFQYIEDKDMCK